MNRLIATAGAAGRLTRQTKGEAAIEKAHTAWLDPDAAVKADVDVLKAALREIHAGKSVEFNRRAGKKRIAHALTAVARSGDTESVQHEWDWLIDNRANSGTDYAARQKVFLGHFTTPLATLLGGHKDAQTKFWLKNTPASVMDQVITASDSSMPADQLWVYACREGLVTWVRDQIGLGKTGDPTELQLQGVGTGGPISGFGYLGTDDFWADLNAARQPLSGFLPAGYDLGKLKHESDINEHGRTVDSVEFPDLKMGLEATAAEFKRRRALFLADVKAYGYAPPTTDELVYWTYVYFNSGENNGQLKKHKGKRP